MSSTTNTLMVTSHAKWKLLLKDMIWVASLYLVLFSLTVPPLSAQITETTKLVADDAAANDFFGNSVAVSDDTAIVGAFGEDVGGSESGSAYIFTSSGSTWVQQGKLTASDPASGDSFGFSVAISGDTALVGALFDDDNGSNSGSAYVFTRNGTTWTQQQKLTASDGAEDDFFGYSVALWGDTAVVGAYGDDPSGSYSGSAYVFIRSGTTWTQQQKLTASDGAVDDFFGSAVDVSCNTAVVGANGDDDGGSDSGSAYVFTRSGTTWTQEQKLTASDAVADDYFGTSVSVSGDTVVVGADGDDDGGNESGSAYVFSRSGTIWTQQQKLTASDADAGDSFGYSVGLSGEMAVIGARYDPDYGIDAGSAYVFGFDGSSWSEKAKAIASDASSEDYFGHSVDVYNGIGIVGAFGNDDDGSESGSAYMFDLNSFAEPPQSSIVVTSPDGGEVWQRGTCQTITWDCSGCPRDEVIIALFRDNQGIYRITGNAPNTGSYQWCIPECLPLGPMYKIRVVCLGRSEDYSDAPFKVAKNPIQLTSPNGGEQLRQLNCYNITWDAPQCGCDTVILALFRGEQGIMRIAETTNTGSYQWCVPDTIEPCQEYRIRAVCSGHSEDYSDQPFTILPKSIQVVSPNGGENWRLGRCHDITWNVEDCACSDIILALFQGEQGIVRIAETTNTGSYRWCIPESIQPCQEYIIRAVCVGHSEDFSDQSFTIQPLPIQLTSPNGGQQWQRGACQTISWDLTPCACDNIIISLFRGEQGLYRITESAPNTGSFLWCIPGDTEVSSDYRIRVICQGHSSDFSDAAFSITGGSSKLSQLSTGNLDEVVVLDGFGALHSSNTADFSLPGPYWEWDVAEAIEPTTGGFILLDAYGGIHAVGNARPIEQLPVYFGWDIARDILVEPNGAGVLVLDGYGLVHPGGTSQSLKPVLSLGLDLARDIEWSVDRKGYFILDGYGAVHPAGTARLPDGNIPYFGWDIARDLEMTASGSGYWILDGFGCVHPAGDAQAFPKSFAWSWDVARDLEIDSEEEGCLILDTYGGIHPVGKVKKTAEQLPYFGWDIARDLEIISPE